MLPYGSAQKVSDRIYVIGHLNPDTDTVAAAVGYAWLLSERDGLNTVPARAGALNRQTAYVFQRLQLDVPILLTDASPRFESVMRRLDVVSPEKSLNEAWSILTRTGGIAPVVNSDGTPYGIISGASIFDFLRELMGPHPRYKDMTLAQLLPCLWIPKQDRYRWKT